MIEFTDEELGWLHGSLTSTSVSMGNADGVHTMVIGRAIIVKLETEAKERQDGTSEQVQ